MRLLKALVGGIIGAAIGAALIIGVEGYMLKEAPWLALAVGVLTGLGVRMMGKSDKPGPCYLCGAIAAALTLLAFVGATLATTKILQAQVEKSTIKVTRESVTIDEEVSEPDTPADADDAPSEDPATAPADKTPATEEPGTEKPAAEDSAATETPAETPAEKPAADAEVVEEEAEVEASEPAAIDIPRLVDLGKPPARAQEFSILSFVLIGVGALIAYELGRSCGCGKAA